MSRSDRKRGPYMLEESYDRIKELAENNEMTVQDALDELVMSSVNESGQITVNALKAKFN